MELVLRTEVLIVFIILRHLIRDLNTVEDGGLVNPTSRNISEGIASTTDNNNGDSLLLDVVHSSSVTLDGKVEATKSVSREGVSSALEENSIGLKSFKDLIHHWLVDS